MAQFARPAVPGVNQRSTSPCLARTQSLTVRPSGLGPARPPNSIAATLPGFGCTNMRHCAPGGRSKSPAASSQFDNRVQTPQFRNVDSSRFSQPRCGSPGQRPDYARGVHAQAVPERPRLGHSVPTSGLDTRRAVAGSLSVPVVDCSKPPALSSTVPVSVPMLHFGMKNNDGTQPNEEQPHRTQPIEPRAESGCFRSLGLASFTSAEKVPSAISPKRFAPSLGCTEKPCDLSRQVHSILGRLSDSRHLPASFAREANSAEHSPRGSDPTNSPAQLSVYPSEDGSGKTLSEKHTATVHSDESLTTEQLRAYKELEQVELACEMKRMENCVSYERDRSNMLQKTFATELMAQKDAHTRDVAALEGMIGKVLAENKRLSNMVEGLCAKVEQGGKGANGLQAADSTCDSGLSTSRSKHVLSGSSSDEACSNFPKGAVVHRNRVLNKERSYSNSSPQPMSSEAEATTDSEQIPSSDDASRTSPPEQIRMPKPKPRSAVVYTCID